MSEPTLPQSRWRGLSSLKTAIAKADQSVHKRIAERFPKTLGFIDWLLEWVFGSLTHPAFGIILGMVLVVLAITGVERTVLVAMFAAWVTTFLWIARSGFIKSLSILSRLTALIVFAALFGVAYSGFGAWAVQEYKRQKAQDAALSNAASSPLPSPETAKDYLVKMEVLDIDRWENTKWLVVNNQRKEAAYIPIAMFIDLVNLQKHSVIVSTYSVEMLVKGFDPIKLKRIPVMSGEHADLVTGIFRTDIGPFNFPNIIFGNAIVPNEPVRGWLFLEVPTDSFPPPGSVGFRLHIKDITGKESVMDIQGTRGNEESALGARLAFLEKFNLKEYEKLRYAEFVRRLNIPASVETK